MINDKNSTTSSLCTDEMSSISSHFSRFLIWIKAASMDVEGVASSVGIPYPFNMVSFFISISKRHQTTRGYLAMRCTKSKKYHIHTSRSTLSRSHLPVHVCIKLGNGSRVSYDYRTRVEL
jgi:hypothetical protein